jgi:hypothetical protein
MARRRTLYLPVMVATALLLACIAALATLLAVPKFAWLFGGHTMVCLIR